MGGLRPQTQAFGLATTGGCPPPASRAHAGAATVSDAHLGLACDNLLSVDVVTATELLTASATEHADLFWACGAGGQLGW